jgi:hypothetical protein
VTGVHHLLISGTGRSGTSFLVRYLAELGLDTHLNRHGGAEFWDSNANAGLEDAPLVSLPRNLPYVAKSPWLWHLIDEVLADASFKIDAVIIPVRDLAEAALSRNVLERRAIHQSAPWMSELGSSWEEWGYVPGGALYSLNPVDQGRLLAVGFHHLVQRLVEADVPIVFLAFPKMIHDGAYLYRSLRGLLPASVDAESARAAHARLADASKVRMETELDRAAEDDAGRLRPLMGYPAAKTLDALAMRRELSRLRREVVEAHETLTALLSSRSWRFTRPFRALRSTAADLRRS